MIGMVINIDRALRRGTIRAQGGAGDYAFDFAEVDGNRSIERGTIVAFVPQDSQDGALIALSVQPELRQVWEP